MRVFVCVVFFFKQKTAYEMRISDWSSDVCSSDLGAAPTFSGKWLHSVQYGVREADQRIDYDAVAELASEYHPKLIIAGGSAYPRQIDFARFREIADPVDAKLMVDMAHFAGLVAGGGHARPAEQDGGRKRTDSSPKH